MTDRSAALSANLQRPAKVLNPPAAYLYAEDEELAQLIKNFKGSGKRKR